MLNVDSELRGRSTSAAGDRAVLALPLSDSRRSSTFDLPFHPTTQTRPSTHVACY